MMSRKLPRRSQRRGLTSFHTSGMTFFSFGLGRFAVRSAAVALPTLREGRSAAFMPPPNLDGPKEEDICLCQFYAEGRAVPCTGWELVVMRRDFGRQVQRIG